jgi:LAS superfamily LD-carboxypeptidase LdcB
MKKFIAVITALVSFMLTALSIREAVKKKEEIEKAQNKTQ